jgi:hypothetical protein
MRGELHKMQVDSLLNEILQLKNVDKVNIDSKNSVTILSKNGKSIFSEVSAVLRDNNAPVETVYEIAGNLDDSFRAFTKPKEVAV